MGREGVAYTFVTTEQGAELTRIEMLINKELKRGEIEGVELTAPVAKAPEPRQVQFFGMGAPPPEPEPKPTEEPPPQKKVGPGGRPPSGIGARRSPASRSAA